MITLRDQEFSRRFRHTLVHLPGEPQDPTAAKLSDVTNINVAEMLGNCRNQDIKRSLFGVESHRSANPDELAVNLQGGRFVGGECEVAEIVTHSRAEPSRPRIFPRDVRHRPQHARCAHARARENVEPAVE
jgi:hypothetical protein